MADVAQLPKGQEGFHRFCLNRNVKIVSRCLLNIAADRENAFDACSSYKTTFSLYFLTSTGPSIHGHEFQLHRPNIGMILVFVLLIKIDHCRLAFGEANPLASWSF